MSPPMRYLLMPLLLISTPGLRRTVGTDWLVYNGKTARFWKTCQRSAIRGIEQDSGFYSPAPKQQE
jgi:hypothetical protein